MKVGILSGNQSFKDVCALKDKQYINCDRQFRNAVASLRAS